MQQLNTTLLAATAVATACLAPLACAQPSAATWDNIDRILDNEERQGFAGQVLLIKDGEVFLDAAYGLADRDNNTPNTTDTIFATGSTPIDFTLVALLQLIDAGKLSLSDPVSKFFDDLPEDRGLMTLDDIRNSASGLPDFPFIRGVDEDPDHSPMTRDEFIERFRTATLLFEPGTSDRHSHFAWGLMAAVIEIASGQTYPEYVQDHIFTPAGMTRSGANGQPFPGETVAIGYGSKSWGDVNSPDHWGPTSWLVMGSGGMVGTARDLYNFNLAINDGTLIPDSVFHLYPQMGVYANGDMYGFETWYNFGGENLFYINCNSSNMRGGYSLEPLAQQLEQLCAGRPPARFSIGIAFGIEDHGQGEFLVAAKVFPGTPAERAGLQEGDVLISCNSTPFKGNHPMDVLKEGLERGETLKFVVERDGKKRTLTLKPTLREP